MNDKSFENIKKVHFIGIGGIGVSAIARMMLLRGLLVSGSDREENIVTKMIAKEGATVFIGHKDTNIPKGVDIIIYSPAIPENNPERQVAHKENILEVSYPEALGILSVDMKTVAVSGTHGKTTTTAMIAEILLAERKDPTIIVGSILKKTNSNFIKGKSELFVVEACEYKRSFLHLLPNILVITNVDADHLDYYKNIDDIKSAFTELVMKVPEAGFIVCNPNDKNIKSVIENAKAQIVDYTKEEADSLSFFGEHNKQNAQAAISVVRNLNISSEQALIALKDFGGVWRRMEYKGKTKNGVIVYDDYAHHPTEIKASLSGLRKQFPENRIIVIFQPHLYSRTKLFLKDFSSSFNDADEVFIMDIYAAREKDDGSIHARDIVNTIGKALYVESFSVAVSRLMIDTKENDVIITMGAGNIHEVAEKILESSL
jgi:UDP-N-acetylmuramate--alanine ligase